MAELKEPGLMRTIMLHAPRNVRLWRNNVGRLQTADGRYVNFGLCEGSSDLIGLTMTTITPEMVGKTVAVFTAIEVKQPGKYPTKEQRNFIDAIQHFGGLAGVARSVEDSHELTKKNPGTDRPG